MNKKVIVAGHICIDITPEIKGKPAGSIQDLFSPGSLINVGAADIHTGGLVANTGLAMKFLGADVSLTEMYMELVKAVTTIMIEG